MSVYLLTLPFIPFSFLACLSNFLYKNTLFPVLSNRSLAEPTTVPFTCRPYGVPLRQSPNSEAREHILCHQYTLHAAAAAAEASPAAACTDATRPEHSRGCGCLCRYQHFDLCPRALVPSLPACTRSLPIVRTGARSHGHLQA
jgi:hypothetical protein